MLKLCILVNPKTNIGGFHFNFNHPHTINAMDFFKPSVSFILLIVFFFLFGKKNFSRWMKEEISFCESEKNPEKVKAPG